VGTAASTADEPKSVAWPTEAEYRDAGESSNESEDHLDALMFHLSRLADPEDGPMLRDDAVTPTFDDLGRLSTFIAAEKYKVAETQKQLRKMDEIREVLALDFLIDGTFAGRENAES
jgi:hypothetical protein